MAQQNTKVIIVLSTMAIALAVFSGQFKQADAFEPLVDTGVSALSPDGRHVGVHVPGFFNMVMDTRGPNKGIRMDQSVMGGLVRISMDRERGSDNKLRGPIKVSVAGMTMYDNGESPLTDSSSS